MNCQKLAGMTAWISGGASGMGEATARLFAAEGACVAIADVQGDLGRAIADDIKSKNGRAIFFECDVTQEDQVRHAINKTADCFNRLDIIVNCAGIIHVGPLHEYTVDEWDRLMAVNVKSIFLSIKYGLTHFRKSHRSYMVNIGSIGSFVGQAHTPAYITSKGAVLQLTRSLALDYAVDGLRVNCICPGITDTPMLRRHLADSPDPEGALAERLRRVPMGIVLMPNDIAKAALYLSCEDSSGITGTSIVVDGGYLAAAEWEIPRPTAFMECNGAEKHVRTDFADSLGIDNGHAKLAASVRSGVHVKGTS